MARTNKKTVSLATECPSIDEANLIAYNNNIRLRAFQDAMQSGKSVDAFGTPVTPEQARHIIEADRSGRSLAFRTLSTSYLADRVVSKVNSGAYTREQGANIMSGKINKLFSSANAPMKR